MITRGIRFLYVGLIWVFLAGILFQVFLAGLGFFAPGASFEAHRNLGWTLHLGPVVLLIVGGLGRVGWRLIGWNALLFLLVGIQPFLPGLRGSAPVIAALHPLNVVFIVMVNFALARRATAFVRLPAGQRVAAPRAAEAS